jgi:hypothetical protein
MNKDRKIAIIVGALILIAYAVLANSITDSKIIVMFFEVISGLAVIGIAAFMFPFFKSYDKKITFLYAIGKYIEGLLMVVAGIFFLLPFTSTLFGARDPIYLIHTYIFILSAALFYYLFYKSELVPRWISVWGFIAVISLLIGNLLEIFYTSPLLKLFYLLIILNEIFLAIWLMVKGFKK